MGSWEGRKIRIGMEVKQDISCICNILMERNITIIFLGQLSAQGGVGKGGGRRGGEGSCQARKNICLNKYVAKIEYISEIKSPPRWLHLDRNPLSSCE